MTARLLSHPFLLPGLWAAAVPWLLFPTIAPGLTAASLLLLLSLLFLSKGRFPRLTIPRTSVNGYLLLFLFLTAAAFVISPLPDISLPKLTVIFLGAVTYFLLFPRLNGTLSIERLITILALCAGMVALAGFFTLEWPDRQILDVRSITDRLPHLSGSFEVNYNEMAGTLLIFFPFILFALRQGNGRFQKTLFAVVLFLSAVLLLFTQSRGAIVGLVVIGVIWRFWGRVRLRRVAAGVVIGAAVLGLAALAAGLSSEQIVGWLSAIDAGSKQGEAAPNSLLTRLEIWQTAVRLLVDYPVFGGGLYTFDPVSRANYIYETILPNFNMTHAHNLLLQTGTSLGVGGILALVGIWGTALVKLWQAGRSEVSGIRELAAVFAAATTGYLFFNLYDVLSFGQKPGLLVWVVLAGGMAISRMAAEEAAAGQQLSPNTGWFALERPFAFVPVLVFIILLFTPALPRNIANLKLDKARFQPGTGLTITAETFPDDPRRAGLVQHLQRNDAQTLSYWRQDPDSSTFLQSQGTIALMDDRLAEAVEWYNLSLELAPESALTYLWRGIANEERGTVGLAEQDLLRAVAYSAEEALDSSTRGYIYYRLGALYARRGDWRAAAGLFAQATVYEPDERWYHRALGDALTELGDEAGASAAYQRAEN